MHIVFLKFSINKSQASQFMDRPQGMDQTRV
jgi:hypothetical protein